MTSIFLTVFGSWWAIKSYVGLNNPRSDVPLYIEQFAEDFIHPTLTPKEFTFYEDPYAWAGRGSDIRFVSLNNENRWTDSYSILVYAT